MVDFSIPDTWISNTLKIGGVLIVLLMVATLIKPSITGNVVNRVNELNTNLTICTDSLSQANGELSANNELISSLQEDMGNMTAELNQVNSEREGLIAERDGYLSKLTETQEALDVLTRVHGFLVLENNDTVEAFKTMSDFAASVLCCPQRFTNNNIDSYNVVKNKIKCEVNGDGDYTLECN